jgi:hypothetical protein
MPYLPMECHILRDVHCILIDNCEHTIDALNAKLHNQYNKLPITEKFIEHDEMHQVLVDNANQLLIFREHIYNFGVRVGK